MNFINKNYNNLLIFLGVILSIFLATILWRILSDNLKLIKYFIYILFPLLVFLYLKNFFFRENIFTLLKPIKDKIKITEKKEKNLFLNFIFLIFIAFVFLEFLSLDLPKFLIDTQHEGNYLSSFQNYISSEQLWRASHFPHGLSDLLYPLLGWKIFGYKTIGSYRLFFYLVILFLKILSIIFVYQITKISYLEKGKNLFFIILGITILSLSSYEVPLNYSPLSVRYIFVVLFLIFFLNIFIFYNKKNLNIFSHIIIVFISFVAFLTHLDIGMYLMFTLFLYSLYLFFIKKYNYLKVIISSGLCFFLFLIFFLGYKEIIYFFKTTYYVAINIETIHGINYPEPFFSINAEKHGMRATKGLLSQIISGIFILNLLIKKNISYNSRYKIFFLFLYILCFVSYFNALGRGDSYHIKMSTGLSIIINTIFISNYFINNFTSLNILEKLISFPKKTIYLIVIFILILKIGLDFKKNKYNDYLSLKDEKFLNISTLKFIDFFSKISKEDKCFLNFTDDVILNFLLKKPSCTRYYSPIFATTKNLQNDYINQLIFSDPVYILYQSDQFIHDLYPSKKLKLINEFIKSQYTFFEEIEGYIIFRKINYHPKLDSN